MPELLEGLNSEQRAAVTTTEGPVLVLAGAGTGKTRVITVRIAHLLAKGVSPRSVLAMTFTNKAAREMRDRVKPLVGKKKAGELTLGTFHAFCVKVLRQYGQPIGVAKDFAICDSSDQITAFKGALRELRVPETTIQAGALQSRISLFKNRLVDPEGFLGQAADDTDELVGRAWRRYEETLKRTKSLDFDDLLLYTLRLLREHEATRTKFREHFRYVMVDEYQDTNGPQYEILRQIAGEHRNLCVVGDDDQSIYGWRGADVSKILGFGKDYPGAKVIRLETNYRSTQPILDAADRLISNNSNRHGKSLRSAAGAGPPLSAMRLEDETQEAEYIAREIVELTRRGESRHSDFAVLFRAAALARPFEGRLRAHAIPYVLVGGMSFFDRKEVRDVLAYLRLIGNPQDEVSLLRVINTPPRGIGKTTIDRVLAYAAKEGIPTVDAFLRGDEVEGVPKSAGQSVRGFQDLLATLRNAAPERGVASTVHHLLEAIGYRNELERLYPDPVTLQTRWAAVDEVLKLATEHERRAKKPSLPKFLQELSLEGGDDQEEPGKRNAVMLMTLHAAKGLEFPRVYLVGLEEGLFPHARAVAEDGLEEERRLMYVGITRARRNLTMTCTAQRSRYGRTVESTPSRFLFELKGEPPPPGWRGCEGGEPVPEDDASRAKKAKKKTRKKSAKKTSKRGSRSGAAGSTRRRR